MYTLIQFYIIVNTFHIISQAYIHLQYITVKIMTLYSLIIVKNYV